MRIMTDDMHLFVVNNANGLPNAELTELINKTFRTSLTIKQVKSYKANHHISSGLDGRFEKGQVPHNKGVKMSTEVYEKVARTMFKNGNKPANHRPVESERISKDGYVEIKVAEPNKWRQKHRVAWEKAFGQIQKGKCLIFLNGDKTDVRIENLTLIDRNINARLNQSHLRFTDADSTKAGVGVAELLAEIGKAKKRKRTAVDT